MIVVRFKPNNRFAFINDAKIMAAMIDVMQLLRLMNVISTTMGDNKLFVKLG